MAPVRGVQGLMEAGQSGRHLRAIRTARREMWDSIASSAGIPVCARVSVGAALSVGDDPFSDAPPHGEEDDIVVIQVRSHPSSQRAMLGFYVCKPSSSAKICVVGTPVISLCCCL